MHLSVLSGLETIDAAQWNRLAGDNPFLQYQFLAALERTGCVGVDTGWEPCHLVLHTADGPGRKTLLGAVPLYLKYHSYGEYVFDWAWADAYAHAGKNYYPKLVAAVPFTPATGPRLLIDPGSDRRQVAALLVAGARELADRLRASSLHWLFHTAEEAALFDGQAHLSRLGYQFHWSNAGYRNFEEFLKALTSHKRNNIRRERRRVREAGVRLETLPGTQIGADLREACYRFYRSTVRAHGGIPYLTREFFQTVGETMKDQLFVVAARRAGEIVATAFGFRNAHTLYGRYWGGHADIPGLHFETCYYTPVEHCIAEGIGRYEAGAQGEHKLARGFVPVQTYSAHWLRDTRFRHAVADYLERERGGVECYIDELSEHSPFRQPPLTFRD